MKSSFGKLIYSIFLTLSVSSLIALIFKDIFWNVFAVVTILQIISFIFFNRIYTNRLILALEKNKVEQLKESNRNYTHIECPCSEKYNQLVDIRFDMKNIYRCLHCNKDISATPSITTVNTSDPLYFDKKNG
jgi:DNA-directed RNA polymerase subunit RPC12/RpoP